jgi:predicted nuclease of restriction endonuclease-like (RecB) superfamily
LPNLAWGHNIILIEKIKDIKIRQWYAEMAIENGWSRSILVHNIDTDLLMELGKGFAFVGKQKSLIVGDSEFFPDLIFYNTELHCYVVVELKTTNFKPDYIGQLNFYCAVVDEQMKSEIDGPTIGILLCQSKDNVVAEFSLRRATGPIGISEYKTMTTLPEELKGIVPSLEEIESNIRDRYLVKN